jgi:hypothetical protein
VASNPSSDLVFAPLQGKPRTLRELLTTFHLCFVAIDPFTHESAWILKTAARVLATFEQADVRVAWVCTGTPDECRQFLGPHATSTLTFPDPDRAIVKEFGLQQLPAIVHVGMDGTVVNAAEGWHPAAWEKVTDQLAKVTGWLGPSLPGPGDPGPFEGSPALG